MAGVRRRRRRSRSRRGDGHGENTERWLLTYADMITLLMALFMVMFSISSVNVSKFEALKQVLNDAFGPKVLEGAGTVLPNAGSASSEPQPPATALIPPPGPDAGEAGEDATRGEDEDFARLKRMLDAYARSHGFARSIETAITRRGLVIRLLTDRVLFASGSAELRPVATPLLDRIARLIELEGARPVSVEGHTDTVPIATSRFPSNWELSGARAASVVRFMVRRGVSPQRLEATGLAGLRPIASNETVEGRSRNRRVEIVLLRNEFPFQGGGPTR